MVANPSDAREGNTCTSSAARIRSTSKGRAANSGILLVATDMFPGKDRWASEVCARFVHGTGIATGVGVSG